MAVKKNGIVVVGSVFVDIKGFPHDRYIPGGKGTPVISSTAMAESAAM